MERRLAAILAADVVGYSRLVSEDEEGTLRMLGACRRVIDRLVGEHRGRIFGSAGDSVIAEFASPVEAVRCAAQIQRDLEDRNAERPPDRRMQFRIGINLGDVIVEGGDLLGDAVNIAARLEALADAGGICLSRPVFDQVKNKLALGYEYLGERQVKNIAEPVNVYRVLLHSEASGKVIGDARNGAKLWKWAAVAAALLLMLSGGVFATAWMGPWAPDTTFSTSPLSAKASIAVLPFSNLNRDPEQEYFSDGITNDLITDLSRFHDLFVIASNSAFTYKGEAIPVQEVGRDLGVRYVLEGSVQRVGGRVRINVQLIDAADGRHLWADRFDEPVTDLFDLQERITKRIVRTLAVRLTRLEQERAFAKATRDLEAYDFVLRGRHFLRRSTRAENFQARQMFQNAIDRDPDYASAYAGLGETYFAEVAFGWSAGSPQAALGTAHDLAQKAIALDGNSAEGHSLLSAIYLMRRQHDLALVASERAIALNPNDARSYAAQGVTLVWSGRADGAILAFETTLRFDPLMGERPLTHLGLAYYLKGRYDDAVEVLERAIGSNPDFAYGQTVLAATYAQMGEPERAARAALAVRRLDPFFTTGQFGLLFREPSDAALVAEGLRKAGLH